ncbi:MAG: amidohydrolase family protein [Pirellulales bacterium]|nr:amidohydrolase family protein [Pirellulales bacterium]
MTRRTFLTATAATGGVLSVFGRARAAHAGVVSPPGLFDCHVHITQPWYGSPNSVVTVRHLLGWMDAHGIAQAAVLPLVSPEAFWYPVTTEFVLRETRPHRDRLTPFCAVDPRTLGTHLPTTKDVVDVLSRYRDAGARGFGEHKPRLPIDDPLCMRLYEACNELELPVLFHLDNQANMDSPGLPGLARVLAAFPKLPFIGHGKGWWASIAGNTTQADLHVGYPRGPVAAGGAIDRLMDAFPNLYGDLSSSGAHAVLRDPAFGREFMVRRAERLLFGTDYYDTSQTDFPHFDLFSRFELPNETVEVISCGNARRILGVAGGS